MGGMVIICDDLINPKQSQSKADREAAASFFQNTLSNRLDNSEVGIFVLIQQRTHHEDIVGIELAQRPEMYKEIIIPAEDIAPIKPEGLRQFYKNGLFEPVRFSKKALKDIESRMTDYPAQYLQIPNKVGGDIWKWQWFFSFEMSSLLRLWELLGNRHEPLVWKFALDGAFTKDTENDPTVCVCYCEFMGRIYIRDIFRAWCSFTELLGEIPDFLQRNGYSSESYIHIEPKANGLDLIDSFVLRGINAIASYHPTKDKIQMAYSVTPSLMAKRVGYLSGAKWIKDLREEIEGFPKTAHDDQIDCIVMIIKNSIDRLSGSLATN
jgi:predicted phage terminase large subunit-like protein